MYFCNYIYIYIQRNIVEGEALVKSLENGWLHARRICFQAEY